MHQDYSSLGLDRQCLPNRSICPALCRALGFPAMSKEVKISRFSYAPCVLSRKCLVMRRWGGLRSLQELELKLVCELQIFVPGSEPSVRFY